MEDIPCTLMLLVSAARQGHAFVAYAGWNRWVLGAWKIATERHELMLPHIEDVVDKFGKPCAVVRDLGRAVSKAVGKLVSQMDPQPRVLACHQHFLRDVGKDLLKQEYNQLLNLFRNFGVLSKLGDLVRKLGRRLGVKVADLRQSVEVWSEQRPGQPLPNGPEGLAAVRAMGQWVLDYAHDGDNQGFPFDRPCFDLYHRCCTVYDAVEYFQQQKTIDRDVRRRNLRIPVPKKVSRNNPPKVFLNLSITHKSLPGISWQV